MSLMSAKERTYSNVFCLYYIHTYYETRTACLEQDVFNMKSHVSIKSQTLNPSCFFWVRGGAGWYVFHGLFGRTFTLFVAMNTLDLARHMSNNTF